MWGLNRRAPSGAGPLSGSFAVRFEGAERSVGAPAILAPVRPASPAAVPVQVGVGAAGLPVHAPPRAEEGALPQDGLQLLHGLPGEARLVGGPVLRGAPLLLLLYRRHAGASARPAPFRVPVGQRADGDDGGGVGRQRDGCWGVDDAGTSPSAAPVRRRGVPPADPHPLPVAQAHPRAIYLVFASTPPPLKDRHGGWVKPPPPEELQR